MTTEQLLKALYEPSMVNNCLEYLEGLEKYPPDGYEDKSLKEYWDYAQKLVLDYHREG